MSAAARIKEAAVIARAHAPYLAKLLDQFPDIAETIDPKCEACLILAELKGHDYESVCSVSRLVKRKIHLLAALCDIAQIWDWNEVTEILTILADRVMALVMKTVAAEMEFSGNDENGPIPGLFILALGKYGARELNYSSDIDLAVFYDPDILSFPASMRAGREERTLIKFVNRLMRGFDRVTDAGYVFRTDLRLRPDPRSTSVIVSTRAAERYYETLGQNWERAAMIKARVCGGDFVVGNEFIQSVLSPFIWRKNLDYAAIADIHSIKRQMQAQMKDVAVPGHHIKLGVGGIREIEFFAQTQQLILGGRRKELRALRTIDALSALAELGFAKPDMAAQLTEDYASLRAWEHRAQMRHDEQTHIWPQSDEERADFAALCGSSQAALEDKAATVFKRVHAAYTDLFPGEEDLSLRHGSLVFTGVEPEEQTLATLKAYGFERGPEIWKHMADWLGGRIAATRTARARALLTRLAPRIIEICGETGAPDTAFFNFAAFITGVSSGITLLSMLSGQPKVLKMVIELLAVSPLLARALAARPAMIDALILTAPAANDPPKKPDISHELDFEDAMNFVRRSVREDQFLLVARLLKSLM